LSSEQPPLIRCSSVALTQLTRYTPSCGDKRIRRLLVLDTHRYLWYGQLCVVRSTASFILIMTLNLVAFLNELGMAQYYESFIGDGFDSWDDVLDITEADMYVRYSSSRRPRL